MRKIFTVLTIAALAAGTASAQDVSFKVLGEKYESGATVTVQAEPQYFDFGDGPEFDGMEGHFDLMVIPAANGTYAMSIELLDDAVGNWQGMWCGVGNGSALGSGACKAFGVGQKLDPSANGDDPYQLEGGKEYDTVYHTAYGEYELPTSEVSCTSVVKAWSTANASNPATITLITKYTPNAVGMINGSDIRFNGSEISAPGMEIKVYSLGGVQMLSARDNASLTDLPAGIYIAKAGAQTRKIAIR